MNLSIMRIDWQYFVIIWALSLCINVQGQNLVPNPGFETYTSCPNDHGQIVLAAPWIKPTTGSSDFFNSCVGASCSGAPYSCVPTNWTGSQMPHGGNGYAGFFVYWDAVYPNFREYIQTPLLSPLVAGVTYDVTFYVSLGDNSGNATNSVGAYLSTNAISSGGWDYFACCASQINASSVITSTSGWTMITGSFLASGNEQYLTIGNFNSSANTTLTSVSGGSTVNSYYYVDDVSVVPTNVNPCSIQLGTDTTLCQGQTLILDATTPNATYLWQDNSTNPTFTVTQAGTYWVDVTENGCTATDTINVSYLSLPTIDLGSDTTLCPNTTLLLDATYPNSSYVWQDNSTGPTFSVSQSGFYDVAVTNTCGTSYDTIEVIYDVIPSINLGVDTVICAGSSLTLDATFPNSSYLWQDASTNATFVVTQVGTYTVDVTNNCGTASDDIIITSLAAPTVNLGNDTTLCPNSTLLLDATYSNSSYAWQDNSTNPTFTVSQSGNYNVVVTNACGSANDAIEVIYDVIPSVNLGIDTLICAGDNLTLDATFPNSSYVWQDASTNATFLVTQAGTYTVDVTNNCGTVSDDIVIASLAPPTIDLGNDTTACVGSSILLDATYPSSTYLWQDGATTPTYLVTLPDTYIVTITNMCGSVVDSIDIDFYSSITIDLGSDTTLCDLASFELNANVPGGNVVWQDNSAGQLYTVTEPGIYIATASIGTCIDVDTIMIDFNYSPYLDLGADLFKCEDEIVIIAPEPVQQGAYSWSTGSTEHTIQTNEFDIYTLTIVNHCGATTDEIEIGDLDCDCDVFFPNSFTPDGDEFNNLFESSHDCVFYNYQLRIFNRWGEIVFESFDPDQGWDATYKGQTVQSGTYTYTLAYRTNNGIDKELNGHVNLVR